MLLVPFIVLFALLVAGVWLGELSVRGALVFIAVCLALCIGIAIVGAPGYYTVVVGAILDLILILKIFRGSI